MRGPLPMTWAKPGPMSSWQGPALARPSSSLPRRSHKQITYFTRKTTYSNREFDIIDFNKWLILYLYSEKKN